ncbi:hypothetical protein NVP1121O_108 [Vibrio phage 1.121.O._10N.286.46.C4]|nr:hypothetical protein NVP1121O_108 [Vibrio phage 1.121.O._10N.286.46.C4]
MHKDDLTLRGVSLRALKRAQNALENVLDYPEEERTAMLLEVVEATTRVKQAIKHIETKAVDTPKGSGVYSMSNSNTIGLCNEVFLPEED